MLYQLINVTSTKIKVKYINSYIIPFLFVFYLICGEKDALSKNTVSPFVI